MLDWVRKQQIKEILMDEINTDFLKEPIGTSVSEMLDFCDKSLKLLNEWKNPKYDYHQFLYD